MRLLLCVMAAVGLLGCGVKGRPLPPEEPPYIGEGQPQQVESTEDPNMPPLQDREEEDEEAEEEEND